MNTPKCIVCDRRIKPGEASTIFWNWCLRCVSLVCTYRRPGDLSKGAK